MKRSETSIWDIFGEYSFNQKFNKTSLECNWNVNWTFMEYWLIHLLWGCYHLTKIPCIWVNDHNSLTWIVGHLGMISRILTMILVRENSEVVMKFTQMYPSISPFYPNISGVHIRYGSILQVSTTVMRPYPPVIIHRWESHDPNLQLTSGKQTVCYWKWWFIVDFPIKHGDFP